MSTGSLQRSSSDDSLEKSRREGSFKYVPAACLPTVHSAEPRLSPNVCRGARSQQSDPRASPSPEGTDSTLRNTSGAEQRGRSGPEPQGTRLASGTYTVSAVDAAEVRGDLAAVMHALGHGACGLGWGPIASAASGLAPSPAVPLATVPRAAQAKEARHAISGPTTWVESAADRGCTPAPHVTRPKRPPRAAPPLLPSNPTPPYQGHSLPPSDGVHQQVHNLPCSRRTAEGSLPSVEEVRRRTRRRSVDSSTASRELSPGLPPKSAPAPQNHSRRRSLDLAGARPLAKKAVSGGGLEAGPAPPDDGDDDDKRKAVHTGGVSHASQSVQDHRGDWCGEDTAAATAAPRKGSAMRRRSDITPIRRSSLTQALSDSMQAQGQGLGGDDGKPHSLRARGQHRRASHDVSHRRASHDGSERRASLTASLFPTLAARRVLPASAAEEKKPSCPPAKYQVTAPQPYTLCAHAHACCHVHMHMGNVLTNT